MPRGRDIKLESDFQAELIVELKQLFPGCIVLKNDPTYQQGIPDLTVLWRVYWAFLEVKPYETAKHQPNQDYFIDMADDLSFGAFIYPENKETILDELQQAFRTRRAARISQR